MSDERDALAPAVLPDNALVAEQRTLGRALLIALNALSLQSAQWAALALSFILFGAAVWWPDALRLLAACCFTVLVQLPVWLRKERR